MTTDHDKQEMLIVTGMSGAGRSTVANALEDLGWYVVDNLPPQMLRPLVELVERAGATLPKIAAVVDIRGRDFFTDFQEILQSLRSGTEVRVIFLEATNDALVRRFEAVRRPHPLQGDGTLLDGISAERARLNAVRESSDMVIDTSNLNIHQLASTITERFAEDDAAGV
ncbi:MAG: RNase adaptor protein RapZ, partial [Cryobacterium sp.]|nr:RNase adaptor protein RapZ [Cryobacterium sp.]